MKTMSWLLVLLVLCGAARAAELGNPAAELKIAKWVKGEPVNLAGEGVYVVEFWATWCPPCRTSIPHLTEIQKRFKDKVTIVGISDEKEGTVAPFVKEWGDKMDYRVAIDDGRKTSAGYMKAYGMNGIPHAFIVQNQKVVWHGHPMAGLDKALEEITSGRYDLEKTKAGLRLESLYREFQQAAAEGNDDEADRLAKELQAAAAGTDSPLKDFDPAREKRRIQTMALGQQFRAAVYRGNDKEAEAIGAKIKAIDPETDLDAIRKELAAQKLASEYLDLLAEGNSPAKEKTSELTGALADQPFLANEVAWQILTNPKITRRDLPLALKIAKQACEDSNWEQPHVIDTYARALFDTGDKQRAIEFQEKAIAAAGDNKAQYEQTLAAYKQGKAPAAE